MGNYYIWDNICKKVFWKLFWENLFLRSLKPQICIHLWWYCWTFSLPLAFHLTLCCWSLGLVEFWKNLCSCFYSASHLINFPVFPSQILLAEHVRQFGNYLHVLALVDFRFLHFSSLFVFSSPGTAEPHGSLWDKIIKFLLIFLSSFLCSHPLNVPTTNNMEFILMYAMLLCDVCMVDLCYVANMVICCNPTTRKHQTLFQQKFWTNFWYMKNKEVQGGRRRYPLFKPIPCAGNISRL